MAVIFSLTYLYNFVPSSLAVIKHFRNLDGVSYLLFLPPGEIMIYRLTRNMFRMEKGKTPPSNPLS